MHPSTLEITWPEPAAACRTSGSGSKRTATRPAPKTLPSPYMILFIQRGIPPRFKQNVYRQHNHFYSASSSIFAFFRSSLTSAAASFSCASSAPASVLPLTAWLFCAGFLDESWVLRLLWEFEDEDEGCGSLASASRRSISFWAFSMFWRGIMLVGGFVC